MMTATGERPETVTADRAGFSLPVQLSGSGTPLIFLHGLGSDARDSRRDLGPMPGIRLALADQRGHGSARPAVAAGQFGLDDLTDDLAAMITALGWNRPAVGGGSMGAAVALRYALRNPAGCSALALVAPALGPERAGAAGLLAAVAARIEAVGLAEAVAELRGPAPASGPPAEHDPGPQAADAPGDPMAPWLRQDGASLAAAMRAVGEWQAFASFGELAMLQLPVVIVGIAGDPLHPAELASRLNASLPDSSLEILPSVRAASRPGAIGAAVLRGLAAAGVVHQAAVNS